MCIRTGCKLLQSGNTSFQKGSIQSPRHCLSNRFFLSTVKDCIHQAVKLLIPVRLLRIPSGQHLLLNIIGSFLSLIHILNSEKSIRSRWLLYWIFIAYSWKCDENERTYDSLHYWRSRWSHIHISCGKFGR